MLRVRAYGSCFFTLGINIRYLTLLISLFLISHAFKGVSQNHAPVLLFRNGRFLLQSSQNIVASSALLECEEALNQGSMTAAEVFISLRSKSILHLFASIGRVLGLEVYLPVFIPSIV